MKSVVRRLKALTRAVLGKELLAKPDIVCTNERFGSDFGGWDVVTTNIDNNSVIYSFGVGEDASFDADLIEKFDVTIHAFDPTPKSIEYVKKQGFSDRFVMHEYGIAAFDGNAYFYPPPSAKYFSYTLLDRPKMKAHAILVPVKRLSTILGELGHDHIDVLKMDIEGAEYDVINDMSKSDIRPQQILVEFHHRFGDIGIPKTKQAIKKLRSMGYRIFSVSTTKKEFCFIRNFN